MDKMARSMDLENKTTHLWQSKPLIAGINEWSRDIVYQLLVVGTPG